MSRVISLPVHETFGGSEFWVDYGLDGALYVVGTAEPKEGQDIRGMAWRILPNGKIEPLPLDGVPPIGVRASVSKSADRAFVIWRLSNRDLHISELPFYVPRGYNGQLGPPIPIQPAPSQGTTEPYNDAQVKSDIASLQKALKRADSTVKALEARIAELEKRPVGDGFDEDRINDHIWTYAPKSVYAKLVDNDPAMVGQIRRIVDVR